MPALNLPLKSLKAKKPSKLTLSVAVVVLFLILFAFIAFSSAMWQLDKALSQVNATLNSASSVPSAPRLFVTYEVKESGLLSRELNFLISDRDAQKEEGFEPVVLPATLHSGLMGYTLDLHLDRMTLPSGEVPFMDTLALLPVDREKSVLEATVDGALFPLRQTLNVFLKAPYAEDSAKAGSSLRFDGTVSVHWGDRMHASYTVRNFSDGHNLSLDYAYLDMGGEGADALLDPDFLRLGIKGLDEQYPFMNALRIPECSLALTSVSGKKRGSEALNLNFKADVVDRDMGSRSVYGLDMDLDPLSVRTLAESVILGLDQDAVTTLTVNSLTHDEYPVEEGVEKRSYTRSDFFNLSPESGKEQPQVLLEDGRLFGVSASGTMTVTGVDPVGTADGTLTFKAEGNGRALRQVYSDIFKPVSGGGYQGILRCVQGKCDVNGQ